MAQRENSEPADAGATLVETATAWFVRLRSGPVSPARRQAFQHWLAAHSAHRRAYAEVQALWGELGHIPDPRPAATPPAPSPRRPWFAAAAVALVAMVATGLRLRPGVVGLGPEYVTAVGETTVVRLADGTTAHLNTDTALDVRQDGGQRRLWLHRGEVWLAVARDDGRPFEVVAGGALLRVLGTAFNVRVIDGAVAVTVAEGRVALAPRGEGRGALLTLGPGEGGRYEGGRAERLEVDPAAVAGWRNGRLVFTDRSLTEVVAEVDRYRPGVILLAGSGLGELRFTGALDVRRPGRALAAMTRVLPLQVMHFGPYLTVLKSRD